MYIMAGISGAIMLPEVTNGMQIWNLKISGASIPVVLCAEGYLDQNILRGGPLMKLPGNWAFRMGISTDQRKKLVFNIFARKQQGL